MHKDKGGHRYLTLQTGIFTCLPINLIKGSNICICMAGDNRCNAALQDNEMQSIAERELLHAGL